ncbi:aquaporin [Thraustotheca clavata]|uniref:Aquaporin n=1 Tax=Thraustotheca clavata TaxID=74557 RepID=A0A1V9YZM5_9STRA|nr:aquaporin [Thraustotheca clavata]
MRNELYSSTTKNPVLTPSQDFFPSTNYENGKKSKAKAPWYRIQEPIVRECLAEVLGTFVMMTMINGVVAQVVLGQGKNGDYTHISIGCGLAVTFGIHASGGVSGAHLNPAVSFALCAHGLMPWRKWPLYMASQMVGAFLGALFVFIIYVPALNSFDPARTWNKTGGIFATYPQSYENHGSAFVCEMLGTFMLMLTIMSVDDPKNMPTNSIMKPITVGAIVVAIGMCFGMPTGYALNPARDFAPRFFTYIAGWGSDVFIGANYYFWVPMVAPLVGGTLGVACYRALISSHHDDDDEE